MTPLIHAAEMALELLGGGYLDTRDDKYGPVAACHLCGKHRTKDHEPSCEVPATIDALKKAIESEKAYLSA